MDTDLTQTKRFDQIRPVPVLGPEPPLIGFDRSSAHDDKIRNYFWNVALRLAPEPKHDELFHASVYGLLWLQPFNELLVERRGPQLALGFSGVDALNRGASRCIVNDWLLAQSRSTVSLLEKACQHV
jgi:hypothetical protein